jgi:hypothetical protein
MDGRFGAVVVLVSCAGVLSCGPTIPTCSAESCAGGCCDTAGVCVAGASVFACGTGGAACVTCGNAERCTGAVCEPLPVDAGEDAGVDGGEDAGFDAGVDAGRPRTVRVVRASEILLLDGGTTVNVNDLNGASVTLFYEGPGGDWVTVSGQNFGTEVRFDGVPEGPYVVSYRSASGQTAVHVASDADDVNLGPKLVGRRSGMYGTTPVAIDAGIAVPWQAGDTLTTTSFSAGMSKDSFQVARSSGASVLATGDLSASSYPFTVVEGDDLTLTLNRQYTDAGTAFLSAAYLGATMPAPYLPSGVSTAFGAPVLTELPRDQATISLRASDFVQFISEVNPGATPAAHRLLVSVTTAGAGVDGGGDYDGRSGALLTVSRSGANDIEGAFSWGNPWGAAAPVTVFRAYSTASVPLEFQGRTLNRNIDALVTTRVGASTVSLGPELSPPRYVRINGETAFVNRNGVSTTPVLDWAPPALGTPTIYTVTLWRLSVQGNNLVQVFLVGLTTPWTRLHLPPGILQPGEAYFAFITASRIANNDPRRTPFRTSRESEDAVAMTNVFTP